jgi:LysR family transcriptional regulator, nitrogen assimilation regulatory protein
MAGSLRDIQFFVAAYEEGSFTDAAARENATQSGVSQHVRSLEMAFGAKLFLREGGRIVPTPAADNFYRHCIELLRAHRSANQVLEDYSKGFEGELVFGMMPALAKSVLAPALAKFLDTHPNVIVRVVEGFSAALTEMAQAAAIDFAIVPAFPGTTGIRSRLMMQAPELLVSAPRSPLVHGEPVRLADLGAIKLALPNKSNTRRNTLETYCATNNVRVERLLELDSVFGTLDLVSRTDWVTILPGIVMPFDAQAREFTVNPIVDPVLDLDLLVIEPARRPLSQAGGFFLSLIESEARPMCEGWKDVRDEGVRRRAGRKRTPQAVRRAPGRARSRR